MKVEFSPVVNFKSSLLEQLKSGESLDDVKVTSSDVPASVPGEQEDVFVSRNLTQEEKIADFQSTLKNKKWEKKYLPESDIVFIKQKKVDDDVEYIIEKDGTVREAGMYIKSSVIMEPNQKMAEVFNSIKAKQAPGTTSKKPGNWLTRGISNIWTTLSVAGTMTVATAKGVFYGVLTGAGVLAASTILNISKLMAEHNKLSSILLNPVKSAGKGGKIAAAVASLAVLASYVISGKLSANENAAVIDHKMHTGHRDA